jgi:23S rRNA pseudouridine1911/1915/1917 synthase
MLAGVRIDRAVSLLSGVSRAVAADLLAQGRVLVDGVVETRRSVVLHEGSRIIVEELGLTQPLLVPEPDVVFGVVFEDDDVVVVNKPWELVVHPGAGRRSGTLAGGLLARYPDVARLAATGFGEADRPGIVHRIDRGTSGLLVVARTPRAFESLSEQMARHSASRRYLALVHGHVVDDRGLIDAPVGRSNRRPTLMTVSSTGRDARTAYEVVGRYEDPVSSTLVVASLETGRTHQVRVHMAAIGHPVVGDGRYGQDVVPATPGVLASGRFFLHAFELAFDHPADGHRATFRAPLAADLVELLGEEPEIA